MNKKLVAIIIGLFLLSPGMVAATSSITDRVNRLEQRMDAWESKSTIQPAPTIQAISSNFMFSGHGNSTTSPMFVKASATITCTTSNSSGGIQVLQVVLCDPTKCNIQDAKAGEVSCANWHVNAGSDVNTYTVFQPAGYYYLKVDAPAQVSWGIDIK